jgi:hypothetical protein
VEEDVRRYPRPAACKFVSQTMQITVKNCELER